ncbi:prepilin-type N-terminal cleavage/methylation domain-containing protein, partial [Candidatus Albibeggiatoa sp. nov. BB20]
MKRDSGFTLLEMLVVLVLVSLISMLLMQGLTFVFQLRTQFVNQIND